MPLRVLIDTNVLLDSFLQRALFSEDADAIIRAHDAGLVTVYVTASSLSDVFYLGNLTRRQEMGYARRAAYEAALEDVHSCLENFEFCAVDVAILWQAFNLPGMDFEDNIQTACAIANRLDAIVTRDKKFKRSSIAVLTPAELLKRLARPGRRK